MFSSASELLLLLFLLLLVHLHLPTCQSLALPHRVVHVVPCVSSRPTGLLRPRHSLSPAPPSQHSGPSYSYLFSLPLSQVATLPHQHLLDTWRCSRWASHQARNGLECPNLWR
ncbi:hypothetical protein EDB80DRAFT_743254 [Ilyonectria destructans]|nr:hypothetical protein EDB80DRAFT_743254 [Ilyonectria destructans]